MRVISPLLKRIVYPSLGKSRYFRHPHPYSVSSVTYHGVLSPDYQSQDRFLDSALVSVENFRAQLRLLKTEYDVISCQEFRAWLSGRLDLPERAVLLTCDDGLVNNLSDMAPALREEGLDCLFFVTGASACNERAMLWHMELYLLLALSNREVVAFRCDDSELRASLRTFESRRRVWLELIKRLSAVNADRRRVFLEEYATQCGLAPDWNARYFETPLRKRFTVLTKAELHQLSSAGMTIGAHSLTHPILKGQDLKSAECEIADCRAALADVAGGIWAFAYPFGDEASVGAREFEIARRAGFECAFINTGGTLSRNSHRYALPRFHVSGDMGLGEFEAHISGFHANLRRRFA